MDGTFSILWKLDHDVPRKQRQMSLPWSFMWKHNLFFAEEKVPSPYLLRC